MHEIKCNATVFTTMVRRFGSLLLKETERELSAQCFHLLTRATP